MKYGEYATAARNARKVLQRMREERTAAVRLYAGNHYSQNGSELRRPVNLLAMYVSIFGRNLVSDDPRFGLSTFESQQRAAVTATEAWLNEEIKRIRMGNMLSRWVVDAMFLVGIAKVHLATPEDSASRGWDLAAGDPTLSRIDFDDFVCDTEARDFEECDFYGHAYWAPLDVVRKNKFFGKLRMDLSPEAQSLYNEQGDEKVSAIGRTYQGGYRPAEQKVRLWELYLPKRRVTLIFSDAQQSGISDNQEPLAEMKWNGPERGPYEFLTLGPPVPGNLFGKAPIMDLIDSDDAANVAYRKVVDTVERIKELALVQSNAKNDGEAVLNGNDGEMILVGSPQSTQQVVFGGQHAQPVMAFGELFRGLFSFVGGNLEVAGGRSQQAGTARQEQLLQENSSGGVADMQAKVVAFTQRLGEHLCEWHWRHPTKVMQVREAPPGLPEFGITRKVYPGSHDDQQALRRRGPMPKTEVAPYSLHTKTPGAKAQELIDFVQQIYAPMAQLFMGQGVNLKLPFLLQQLAKYKNSPDLADLVGLEEPQGDGPEQGHETGSRMPQATERTYTRQSESAGPDSGNHNMVASMLGGDLGGATQSGMGA